MEKQWDPWSLAAAAMWVVYFLIGLNPEAVFYTLRDWGGVSILTAMVNSPHLITLAFSSFLGLFAYHRCLNSGLSGIDSKARAMQFTILGLVAFLNFPLTHVARLSDIPDQNLRVVVVVVALAKVSTWFYLLFVVLRYSLFGHTDAFTMMASVFPSTRREGAASAKLGETSSVAWIDRQKEFGEDSSQTVEGQPHESALPEEARSRSEGP